MYTIKNAAEMVGISTATLRAWERRYQVVTPERTAGGYRVYHQHDMDVLLTMKQLIEQGWKPELAAQEASSRVAARHPTQSSTVFREAGFPHLSAGGARWRLGPKLIEAATALDTQGLSFLLDQIFAVSSFETVMREHLFPALTELGNAWSRSEISVAGEHLVSHAVMRRLALAYEAAGSAVLGPRISLGMAPNSRHEIGLLSFAITARRAGLRTDYLGGDLPLEDWSQVALDKNLSAVVLAIPTEDDVSSTNAVIDALRSQRPELLIAVGGAEQEKATDDALRLGHDLVEGVNSLIDATAVSWIKKPRQESADLPERKIAPT